MSIDLQSAPPATKHRKAPEAITLKPWNPSIGTRVSGYRYEGGAVPRDIQEQLKDALFNTGVLVFDPGVVTAANFTEFAQFLGEPYAYGGPHTPKAEDNPDATVVDSVRDKFLRNHIWHVDGGFKSVPAVFTALFAKLIPDNGGDTVFSNAQAAYESFDPLFQAFLDSLEAVTFADATGHLSDRYFEADTLKEQLAKHPPFARPLIEKHPVTGRKRIAVNESYTNYIRGQTRIVSQNILGILFDTIKSSEFCGRLTWEQGMLAIWDNRVVQHQGVKDYSDARRILYRITLT